MKESCLGVELGLAAITDATIRLHDALFPGASTALVQSNNIDAQTAFGILVFGIVILCVIVFLHRLGEPLDDKSAGSLLLLSRDWWKNYGKEFGFVFIGANILGGALLVADELVLWLPK